ncbi:MAG: hypothetical protein LBD75_04270 [Candidatus Peribacteria bacterium]|nr:hypothetical protein [Candidatus Peribacteria bacterium]
MGKSPATIKKDGAGIGSDSRLNSEKSNVRTFFAKRNENLQLYIVRKNGRVILDTSNPKDRFSNVVDLPVSKEAKSYE